MVHIQSFTAQGFRISVFDEHAEVGHAYLYVFRNDLHAHPFGLLEDLQVEPEFRHRGFGTRLITEVMSKAKEYRCYKLIATSRADGTRDDVHAWYARLGFAQYGTEFRMDLSRV